MAEPSDKLARYQGCANWHTWHVIRIVADVDLIDVVRHCTPEELRWIVHHQTPAVANGCDLTVVDWNEVVKAVGRG